MGQMDEGVSGAKVDEGCSRVMEDRAKWMEGEMETTKRPTSHELHHERNAKSTTEESSYL
jgi:hypothetical protein